MSDHESQSDLFHDLPAKKDIVNNTIQEADLSRPLAPHERRRLLARFRKVGDTQGEVLLTDMLGYAGTTRAPKTLPAEDPLEAIHGPSGGLTPYDQDRLFADQQRLDEEFENSRSRPSPKAPIRASAIQHRLFSDTEFQYLKNLTRGNKKERESLVSSPMVDRGVLRVIKGILSR